MKKLFYFSVLMTLFLGACEVLDVEPYHSIPADEAITNAQQAESAILGCYDALQSDGYYGLNYMIFGDLPADNLTHVGVTVTWVQFDNNAILADNGLVESTWAAIYRVLNRVNNAIYHIQLIDGDKMTEDSKNVALAELRFLRALAHYDLMRLFGPVPLRDQAVGNNEESYNPARNSVEEVLLSVKSDLDFAINLLSPAITKGRASKPAAQALKARIALHQYYISGNAAFLTTAIDMATQVIDHPSLQLVPDYATLFNIEFENNSESIFQVTYNDQDRNLTARYFAHTSNEGRYEFAPTTFYMNSFETNDVRKDASVKMAGSAPYAVKFNDVASGTDPVYVLRLAEIYLIRAEAKILQQGNIDDILNDVNIIRQRANLQPVNMTSYASLKLEVESQRQKEFAFEGYRWFDLVRTNRAIEVIDKITNTNQYLFPIPQAEIIANNNPGMYQNDGY
ncbi:MAG: RagB/SusD family nutrient uptake outer membrane protein [Bacteroidales bacterium]|nr:RagB/SusD family nutrient uptake outer membrane protein [Bacteroidales bacterium]